MNTGIYAYLAQQGQMPQGLGPPKPPLFPPPQQGFQPPPFGAGGLGPMAAPAPPPAMPAPDPNGGILGAIDRIFGGPEMANLSPAMRKKVRSQGLLTMGAQLLTATDPHGNRAQGLAPLGQAIFAGQQAYGQGIEQAQGQAKDALRAELYSQFAPRLNESADDRYSRTLAMFDAAFRVGDTESMKFISQALNTMPKPGESESAVTWQNITDEQGNIVQLNPKTGEVRPVMGPGGKPLRGYRGTAPGGPVNWQTTTAGDGSLVQVNPRTGETRPVMDAQGHPMMGQRKPLTEAETKGATFHNLASEASDAMDSLELSTPQSPGSRVAAGIPLIGNAFRSSVDQQRGQVAQQFINAILRRESGAAVPDTEYPKYEAVYIPVYGDSPETLARKAKARKTAIQALKLSAGRALDASPPGGVVNEFADVEAAFQ